MNYEEIVALVKTVLELHEKVALWSESCTCGWSNPEQKHADHVGAIIAARVVV